MKSISLVLAAGSLLASGAAFAEVKENGTLVPVLCGSTSTFPVATAVCVVSVQGSSDLYLSIDSYRSEVFPPQTNENDVAYAYVKSVKTKGNKTIYKAVLPSGETGKQQSYELIVEQTLENGVLGGLKVDGHFFFGSEHIMMNYMATTL